MLIFKCPECEDSLMGFNEAENTWVCSEGECQHEIEADEADQLFEAGEIVGHIVESEDEDNLEDDLEEKDMEKDDEEDDEEDEEEEDDDSKDESFNGFANRDTWMLNLVVQNEYKLNKGALATVSEENAEEALKKFVEENVANNDDFAGIFENELEDIDWTEIVESLKDAAEEFAAIRADLEEALGVNEDVAEEERTAIVQVFESALMIKYNELKANLEEKMSVELAEAKEENYKELTTEMSGYLEEAVAEWMEDNKLAIQHGIQIEMTQNFMDGLKDLYEKFYIDVPEERYDVLEDMSDKIEQMEEEISNAKAREADLQKKIDEATKERVVNKLSEELTDTQVEKLEELAGSIDYESEEQFESALSNLKESFLKTPKNRKEGDTVIVEEKDEQGLNEKDDDKKVDWNDPKAIAARALRKRS